MTREEEIEFRRKMEQSEVRVAEGYAKEKRYSEAARFYIAAEVHQHVRKCLERIK